MEKTFNRRIISFGSAVAAVAAFQLLTIDYGNPQAVVAEEQRWQTAQTELAELRTGVVTTTQPPTTTVPPTIQLRPADKPVNTVAATTTTTTTTTLTPTTTTVALPPPLYPGDIPSDTVFGWLTMADLGKIDVALIEGRDALDADDIDKYALDHGVAHRPGTAYPGSGGNVVISGHRTSAQKDVFLRIGELQHGQLIEVGIVWHDRQDVYTYQVERVTDMIPNDGTIPQQYFVQQADYETLTLITCTPPGKVSHRLIVLAKLAQINGVGV